MKNDIDFIRTEVMDFLRDNNTAVIATCLENQPHASAIHFESDENLNMYFMSYENTKKYMDASKNNKASIVIGAGPKHVSLQAVGEIHILVGKRKVEILEQFQMLKRTNFIVNAPTENMNIFQNREPVIFEFKPKEMSFMNLDDESYPNSLGRDYHKII